MVAKGLLLKGGAGLATAAAGGTGIYYGVDHYLNQLTKFDQGLIDHLNEKGKIKFAVLNGSDGTTALSSFPTLTNDQTVVAIVKVSTNDTTSESTEGKIDDKDSATDGALGTKKYLKKLNGDGKGEGADWTWTCEIKFKKGTGTNGANELKAKDEIFKNDGSGFLNKLKGDGEKDLKIKFIRDCAKARTKEKNRVINGLISLVAGNDAITEANKIKSTKEFTLRAGKTENTGEVTTNLYPVKKWEFNDWFSIKEQK